MLIEDYVEILLLPLISQLTEGGYDMHMGRPGYEAESVAANFIFHKNSCQHAKDYELTTIRTNDNGLEVHTLFPIANGLIQMDLFPITVCLQSVVINTFDTNNF